MPTNHTRPAPANSSIKQQPQCASFLKYCYRFRPMHFLVLFTAILFGIAYMLTPYLLQGNSNPLNIYRLPIGIVSFLFVFCVAFYAVQWYHQPACKAHVKMKCSNRVLFWSSFFLIFAVGVFWLLIYYPGVGMYDTIGIIKDENFAIAKQHPWFYIFLIQLVVRITFSFGGGYEAALVAESLLQITVAAAVSAHCVVWLKRRNVGKLPLLMILSIYAFCPILNLYMISLFKDIPFSYMLVEWGLLLYEFWESKGENLKHPSSYLRMAVCIVLSLMRNNGIYISFLILFCMLVLYRNHWKKIVSLFLVLFVVIIGSAVFEKTHSITHLFKETVGIPLQQIAATVSQDGEITEDQLAFIDQVIPLEFIQEKYNPYSADTLKWGGAPLDNTFLNEHKREFLKVWAEMLVPNFKIYVKAYLQNTYGFWATNSTNIGRYNTIYVSALDEWFQDNDVRVKEILPEPLQSTLETITYAGTDAWGSGQLFWIFVFLMLLLILLSQPGIWIIAVPSMSGWLTIMISTPVAFQWRYVLFIAYTLPLLFGMLLIPKNEIQALKSEQDGKLPFPPVCNGGSPTP